MIKNIRLITLIAVMPLLSLNQNEQRTHEADDIVATWLNADKDAHIRIFKAVNGKYAGKIEWMKEPLDPKTGKPKTDNLNPDPKLRNRERMGLVIMMNFEYIKSKNKWEGGTIYDPKSGKTYDSYIYFDGNNKKTLFLRGYVMGMTWIGRTSEWTKVE